MFNKLRLFLKGKSTQIGKEIVKNEAYWDGKLKDCRDKMKNVTINMRKLLLKSRQKVKVLNK